MSLEANIDHLKSANGIEAVLVEGQSGKSFRGPNEWEAVLDQALTLFGISKQNSMRIVVGEHTLVVQKEGSEVTAVALPTGHPVAKSLRRMIRRMSRKVRPALAATRPAPFALRNELGASSSFSQLY